LEAVGALVGAGLGSVPCSLGAYPLRAGVFLPGYRHDIRAVPRTAFIEPPLRSCAPSRPLSWNGCTRSSSTAGRANCISVPVPPASTGAARSAGLKSNLHEISRSKGPKISC
jgi:hypothetical protein